MGRKFIMNLKKYVDTEMLIDLLIVITIAGLAYTSGYFKGRIIEKENELKLQEKYEGLEKDYLNYMEYCDKHHYVLYHYGVDGLEVEEKQ